MYRRNSVKRNRVWLVALLFLAAALLMSAGIYRGELKIVLMKATNICLECIGIG